MRAKKRYYAEGRIEPQDRIDLERLRQIITADNELEGDHKALHFRTADYTARSYWGAFLKAEQAAKALCRDVAGPIVNITLKVTEVV